MTSSRYDVVFYGEIIEGFELDQVKRNFGKLFKLADDRVEKIFQAGRVSLKSGVSQETAEQFQAALKRAGATVVLEAVALDEQPAQAPVSEPTPVPAAKEEQTAALETAAEPLAPSESVENAVETGSALMDETPDEASTKTRRLPFVFNGDGAEYFKIWIVNIFLTIVTLGIYSAWAKVRNNQYFYGNTELDGASFSYLADPITILKGRVVAVVAFIAYSALGAISPIIQVVMALLLVLALPWLVVRSLAFTARNSGYRNLRFNFHGDIGGAVKAFIGWPLLGIISLGLLFPLCWQKQQEYMVSNYSYGTARFTFSAGPREYYMIFLILIGIGLVGGIASAILGAITPALSAVAVLIMYLYIFAYMNVRMHNLAYNAAALNTHGFDSHLELNSYAQLFLVNTLATVATLGLFIPWAKVRTANYIAEHMHFNANGDLNKFVADEQEQMTAFGEEVDAVFDLGIGL